MKKTLIVVGLVGIISACGGSVGAAVSQQYKPQTNVTMVTTPNEYGRFQYRELKINGRSCILADYDYAGYLALTCDWSAK